MVLFLNILILSFATAYLLLMAAYCIGWHAQKSIVLPKDFTPHTFISIIIPARNEEQNITNCINSILSQVYPRELYEIIVVDDHSTDGTADCVHSAAGGNVKYISLEHYLDGAVPKSHKKAAITAGVNQSKGELIITTDADCTALPDWLKLMAYTYETNQKPDMVVAPVAFTCNYSVLETFQLLDFMSMQGITAATNYLNLGYMSNGANLAFAKQSFQQVGGYTGLDHLATGDDYLLMVKIANQPRNSIKYLKSQGAIVSTLPQTSWKGLLQQRIRWASKSGKYPDNRLTAVLVLVYMFNCSFLVVAIAGIFYPQLYTTLSKVFVAKVLVEYVFLIPVALFFKRTRALLYFPFLQPLHIAYIIVAGFFGFWGSYEWKGRQVG